jgi:SAM-dependent methyltransferase
MAEAMARLKTSTASVRIFDAFGGAGFLSRSFMHTDISFTIADCTSAYHPDSCDHHEWLVSPDYFRSISMERMGQYDLVFAHGGLHHVFEKEDGEVQDEASLGLQNQCVANLARLLRPGGYMVLADIPNNNTHPYFEDTRFSAMDPATGVHLFSGARVEYLQAAAHGFSLPSSLKESCTKIAGEFRDHTHSGSLQRFFTEVIADETPYGHDACFVDFPRIIAGARSHGLSLAHCVDYPGAWVFRSIEEAIWFFREKFSFGTSSTPFVIHEEDRVVESAIADILGIKSIGNYVAVNWGVTYAVLVRS